MNFKHITLSALAVVLFTTPVLAGGKSMKNITKKVMDRATVQFEAMDARLATDALPRSYANGKYIDSDLRWWCSGFFGGSLWYVYEASGNEKMKELAIKNTLKVKNLVNMKTDHDIGFMVNCSFGNMYRLTGDESCLPVLEKAAGNLATRFNPTVGCIKSWDNKKYHYPVIIDNMMNLELLTWSSKKFGCDSLMQIACTHANTTMKNHFRPDFSCYHLVDYVPATGAVDHKQTVQGYADETSWTRGQAWGLYGYTMMYDQTGKEEYLRQAEAIARYILPLLPSDGIPYWDFNAPGTPHAVAADAKGCPTDYRWKAGEPVLRDASAGAIMASAFVQLSRLTKDKKLAKQCKKMAEKEIRTFASDEYLAAPGENGDFLLKHSVGNLHNNSEVDVPLTYADYYFLEAIVKYNTGK